MEGGIVVFDGAEQGADADLGREFFTDFAVEGLFGCFARFHLSSGKFPPVFPFAVSALGGKDASVGIADDGGCDFCLFHRLFSM